ncbi:MAG: hypothetical protein LBM75_03405 [Myxococcales bacterium]|jgi:hypothetical protein|nr:hypothetical protein [Myxococcales bacterium]
MLNIGKLLFLSVLAIGIGVFLGTVPLSDGRTAAEHGEAWFDSVGASPSKGARPRRVELHRATRTAAGMTGAAAAQASPVAPAQQVVQPSAPITAGAANTPDQASASDKAALDALISRRAAGR